MKLAHRREGAAARYNERHLLHRRLEVVIDAGGDSFVRSDLTPNNGSLFRFGLAGSRPFIPLPVSSVDSLRLIQDHNDSDRIAYYV
ncbi:Hypothetical protein NTJ_11241 [Nesidiocoris tenuis]|nr:Hypothetical protein NTJ_11241 [Nesidiocoris tenuis]